MSKQKTVLTYGTFDMFHIGHLNLLKNLTGLGERLIVGVSSDAFNKKKGKDVLIPYNQRAEIVANIKGVSEVICENSWDQKIDDIQEYNVDVFAIGDDWKGKFDFLNEHCEVVYLPRTKGVSTSELKQSLSKDLVSIKKNLNSIIENFQIIVKEIP